MRLSRFFLPILKENPKEAEIVSHRLMLRAGMIRQEAAASWLPQFLRALSYAIPHTYAMQGFQDVLVRGQGLAAVWPELLALLGFTALAFFVAVRRFDFGSAT